MGIYVGYESPQIIKYLEPNMGIYLVAMNTDCKFNESDYPTLGGENNKLVRETKWHRPSLSWQDPRTKECEIDIQRLYIYKAS